MRQPWVKIHREMLANPKYGILSGDARLVFYELLLCSEDDGALPAVKDLAWMMRRLPADLGAALDELAAIGWMEWDGQTAKFLHWTEYQGTGKSSAQRSRDYRQRRGNVAATSRQRTRDGLDVEEEVEEEEEKKRLPVGETPTSSSATAVDPAPKVPDCPQQAILDLYHRILPELPRMRTWGPDRQANLRSRWREDPKRQDLAWWETLFTWIRKSDFLMGRSMPVQGRPVFLASLAWLTLPRNWGKLQDGAYHREAKNMSRQEWAFAKAMERINAETEEEVQ